MKNSVRSIALPFVVAAAAILASACSDGAKPPATSCEDAVPEAVRVCVDEVSSGIASCYADNDGPCAKDDANVDAALRQLETTVSASCSDGEFLGLSAAAVGARVRNACASEAASMGWRTFGGPQGASWEIASAEERSCLQTAHTTGARLAQESLALIRECLAGEDCDGVELATERSQIASDAREELEQLCPELGDLIAVSPSTLVDRVEHQADCIAAASEAAPGPAQLSCGASNSEFNGVRGEWTQIIVDGARHGTMCGDGSDYAFWIYLAPEGAPIDRMIIGLQGGGVCLFGDDCSSRFENNPGLFTAMDDLPYGGGVASNDPEVSRFAEWTKIYLPYCTQDVFTGGGVVEEFEEIDVLRYGGKNLRVALRMARDSIWKTMDEEGGNGFRPDELIAFFGGWSAGGYGTIYNYHFLLDELQWPRTIAFPDAGMALDNGSLLGVRGLGLVKIPAWGVKENLPGYCFEGDCAVGPILYEAISPRLQQVPQQNILVLSNQKDETQRFDAFFTDEPLWYNTLRENYCQTRDLPGIYYYLSSESVQSIHVISIRDTFWKGEVDGQTLEDFFWDAAFAPENLRSRVEEGDFTTRIEGVLPFPCDVAP